MASNTETTWLLVNDPDQAISEDQTHTDNRLESVGRSGNETNSGSHAPVEDLLPQDGWIAWTQVVAGHLALFNSWGYINSYALFESYYKNTLGLSLSNVSWAGSVQIFLVFFIGTLSGRLADAGYFRVTILTGMILQLLAVFATSFCVEFWQLLLAQGICGGIGDGLIFTPMISLVSTWFARNKTLAMCTIAAGTGIGGVIFPLIAQQLLSKVGFGWTVRVMGFVILFNNIVIFTLARPRLPPRSKGPLVEWSAFQEGPYTLFTMGMFMTLWALYVAFSFITEYAKDVVGVSDKASLTVLFILNAMGAPGRIIPGLIADICGPLNTMIPFIALTGILFYCWIALKSTADLFVFTIVFGLIDAAVQGLVLGCLASVTTDPSRMGTRSGMILSCVSFAALTGAPTFGALVDYGNGSFLYAQIWGGTTILVGGALIAAARIALGGWDVRKKL